MKFFDSKDLDWFSLILWVVYIGFIFYFKVDILPSAIGGFAVGVIAMVIAEMVEACRDKKEERKC